MGGSQVSVKRIRGDSDVVGDDRDVASVLSTLRRGVSLVVIGPLGSGKSHFLRHLVERLEEADDDEAADVRLEMLSGDALAAEVEDFLRDQS